jgi:ribonuclease Z
MDRTKKGLQCGDLTLCGVSIAGEQTAVAVPELDVCFDIGLCPRVVLPCGHVCLTHGHMDHAAGLAYYFSQRDFQGMQPGVALVPKEIAKPVKQMLKAWDGIEGKVSPRQIVALGDGDEYEIRRNLRVRAFRVPHTTAALGYLVYEQREKLLDKHLGLTSAQIVQLKNQNQRITRSIEVPLVCYLGDLELERLSWTDMMRQAKILIIECTFFEDDHKHRARYGQHVHLDDLLKLLGQLQNEYIVLTHLSRRTDMRQAKQLLNEKLEQSQRDRIRFFMSR